MCFALSVAAWVARAKGVADTSFLHAKASICIFASALRQMRFGLLRHLASAEEVPDYAVTCRSYR